MPNAVGHIKQQIADLNKQLVDIQAQCCHPPVVLKKTHKASTGNYDPSQDSYWTEFHCGLCDKFWTEEGSK